MKKTLFAAYALTAYAIGLASTVYLMGFMIDSHVSKTINSGRSEPMVVALLIDLVLLIAFGSIHSVMARPAFKIHWTRVVPAAIERSTYILISGLSTFAIVWAWHPLPQSVWHVEQPLLEAALYATYALGWLLIAVATFNIDHLSFFGLRPVWDHVLGRPSLHAPFTARMLYGIVRHPISLGWIIVFWSSPYMTLGHLIFATCMTLYIVIVTPIEEADLEDALGDRYRQYARQVDGFIPYKKLKRR